MIIKAIIQSRMTSRRFPGKMLASFLGKPILAHVVDSIKRTQVKSSIILATSEDQADDPLAIYGKYLGLKVVRGSREDVAKRYALVLDQISCDAFFRVCGDSPLLLPCLFDKAISIYKNSSYDIVTNVFPRTFPIGMSIELIRTKTFLEIHKKIIKNDEREHLTKYFYKNSKKFQIHNIKPTKQMDPKLKLAVDEMKDLKRIEKWYLNKRKIYKDLFLGHSIK